MRRPCTFPIIRMPFIRNICLIFAKRQISYILFILRGLVTDFSRTSILSNEVVVCPSIFIVLIVKTR